MAENAIRQGSVNIGLPVEIVKKIDRIRGDVPCSAFLRRRLITLIENMKEQSEN